MENRNNKVLESFVAYCKAHPGERFWQALRNWSGRSFIYLSDSDIEFLDCYAGNGSNIGVLLDDTFYWEDRDS